MFQRKKCSVFSMVELQKLWRIGTAQTQALSSLGLSPPATAQNCFLKPDVCFGLHKQDLGFFW